MIREDDEVRSVSFVVATFNEQRYIGPCLASLLQQDYPSDRIDIAVVDGGSTDGTTGIVEAVGREHPRVRLYSNPRKIAASAFNIGIKNTSGDVVSLAGAHSCLRADYASRLVAAFHSSGAGLVGGRALAQASRPTPSAAAIARVMSSPFGVGAAKFRYADTPGWVNTAFPGAYRRWLFDRIGHFDEDLVRNQDDEFHLRAARAGYPMWYDPELVSTYFTRPTFGALGRQYFDYGRWRAATVAKHAKVASVAQLAPPALVLGLAAAVCAPRRARRLLTGAIAASYSAVLVAGMVRETRRGADPVETALVAPGIATLHLSYGLGFWRGVAGRAAANAAGPSEGSRERP
jgi:succinoglycan biosynthesis protein ExoA